MAECPDEAELLAFVRGRSPKDDTTRLHQHVESCQICYQLVVQLLGSSEPTPPDPEAAPLHPDRTTLPTSASQGDIQRGATVGRYIVLDIVGRGGMGVVYSAYDPDLDRKIALKVLRRRETASDEEVEKLQARLRREAQAMARLSHPNVVTVFDVGVALGQVFVAMELVEGTTLAGWLSNEPPVSEIMQRFIAAGRGLAAAHAAGFVHRDFKPENVLLGRDGRVCVTDFGLVRTVEDGAAADPPSTFDASLTHPGRLLGTPAYMSPEQLRAEAADPRADQFSFCLALYEALWRERPFAGTDLPTLLESIEAGRLRHRSGVVPPRMMRAVIRGLRAKPSDRWASMEELLAELTVAPRRFRYSVAVALLASVSSLALGYRLSIRPPPCQGAQASLVGIWDTARRQQVAERMTAASGQEASATAVGRLDTYARSWAQMQTESCEATRIRGQQSEELLDLRGQCLRQRLDELRAVSEVLARPSAATHKADELLGSLTPMAACADIESLRARSPRPKDPALRREVESLERRLAETRAQLRAGLTRGTDFLDGLSESAAARAYPPLRAALLEEHGELLVDTGHFDEGVGALKEASGAALACGADEVVFAAWDRIAYVLGYVQEHPDQALGWLDLAGAALQRLHGREDLSIKVLLTRAEIDDVTDRLDDEEATLRRAIPLADRTLSPGDPDIGELWSLQASVLAQRKQLDASVAAYRTAISTETAARGPESPQLAPKLYNLGLVLEDAHRYDEALVELARSLALDEKQLPPGHPFTVSASITVGEVYIYTGQLVLGRALLERALPLAEKHAAEIPQAAPQARSLLGRALLGLGKPREAIPLLQASLRPGALKEPRLVADAKLTLARALLAAHRNRAAAVALAKEARALYAAQQPVDTGALAEADQLLTTRR